MELVMLLSSLLRSSLPLPVVFLLPFSFLLLWLHRPMIHRALEIRTVSLKVPEPWRSMFLLEVACPRAGCPTMSFVGVDLKGKQRLTPFTLLRHLRCRWTGGVSTSSV